MDVTLDNREHLKHVIEKRLRESDKQMEHMKHGLNMVSCRSSRGM